MNDQAKEKKVGIFSTQEDAIRAIKRLKISGYKDDEISVLAKEHKDIDKLSKSTDTNVKTVDVQEGAAGGAVAAGLIGVLIDMGLTREEAKEYEDYLDRGYILIMVDGHKDRGVYDNFYENNSIIRDRYKREFLEDHEEEDLNKFVDPTDGNRVVQPDDPGRPVDPKNPDEPIDPVKPQ